MVALLQVTGEGAENDGQMRGDRVALVVEHGPGAQVRFRHPKGHFDVEEGRVGGDDVGPGKHVLGDVGDVALQAEPGAGLLHLG